MAKHEFHTLDECPVHNAWLRGERSQCYMIYVERVIGKNFPRYRPSLNTHRQDVKWQGKAPYVWFHNGDLVRLDNKSNLEWV